MVKVKEDMTGWKMWEHGVLNSRLSVIRQVEDFVGCNGQRRSQWLCECSCDEHNQVKVIGKDIKNGRVLSCGCYRREMMANRNKVEKKKYNVWRDETFTDEHGSYRVGFTSNMHKEFYVDSEDYDKVKDYCWHSTIHHNAHQISAWVDGKHVRMHILLGFKNFDHADRNELNNRKYNLRECTPKENARNRSRQANNTSGIIGVCLSKGTNKWYAYIKVDGDSKHLGCYVDKDDAVRARLLAEMRYFGSFAPQRHLFEQYGVIEDKDVLESKYD